MPLVTLDQALSQPFDYIVIGGGTAGLVVASRLSEDPEVSVLVLDAGNPNLNDPLITRGNQWGSQFGNPRYDWAFKTAPQKHMNGKEFMWSRGKSLGGSSAMNFQLWSLPPKRDIDDWEKLGNKGWNWTTYEKYLSKAATYVPIDATTRTDAKSLKATWDLEKRSNGAGPLFVTHPKLKFEIDYKAHDTLLGMGIPEARAPYHGETTGVHIGLSTIEPRTHTRSYAATSYFVPASTRTNLFVLTTAYAHRLVTTGQGDGNIVATGVEFNYGDDKKVLVAHAKREVIISAGALKSPQILELSGIGREDVLSRIGVPVKISLDGVGENVQEHTFIGTVHELKEDTTTETLDMLRDEKIAAQHIELLAKGEGAFTSGFTNVAWVPLADVTSRSQALYEQEKKQIEEDVKTNSAYPPGLLEQYDIQLERIPNGGLDCEIAVTATFLGVGLPPIEGKKYVSIAVFLNHAFSRGTIHSSSNDPSVDPEMDPHYWEHRIDRDILLEGIKYARKIAQASPLRDEIACEYIPGPGIDTDEKLAEWGKDALGSTWHTAGSCSMLPREKNGVVDTHLKVYGTKNIRVVDLSVVPLNIAAHTQATVYTIAELASDIIKGKFYP